MTGGDAIKIARRVLALRQAELRRDKYAAEVVHLRQLLKGSTDGMPTEVSPSTSDLDAARHRLRSAASAVGGIRRGIRRTLDRVLRVGVDLPKLKTLPFEELDL
jgi:hypothetical protein